jgi:tetratricopeptide (TPR) repeat protein
MAYLALAKLRMWQVVAQAPASLSRDAQNLARSALELNPNLGEAHLALGIFALCNANFFGASRRIDEAVRCNPALSESHRTLGYLHSSANRTNEGSKLLELSLRIEPRNLAALWDLAYVVALTQKNVQATIYLDQADAIIPNHPETLLARVRIGLWLNDKMMLAWVKEHASLLNHGQMNTAELCARMFIEPETDEAIGALTAIAACAETPTSTRVRIMQMVAERMALGGKIEEAWSALRAASAHTIDAIWFQHCPALARMSRIPAFISLRSQVTTRAAQVFDPQHQTKRELHHGTHS